MPFVTFLRRSGGEGVGLGVRVRVRARVRVRVRIIDCIHDYFEEESQ